jgi:hypothetical protein
MCWRKKKRYPSAVESAFRAEFPTVFQAIKRINGRDHGELIRMLQRLESWLVIETVAPKLLAKRVPTISLHDAIYSQRRSVAQVADAFVEVFRELDVSISLHKED